MPEQTPPSPSRLNAIASSSPTLPSSAAATSNAPRSPGNQPTVATANTNSPLPASGGAQPPQTPEPPPVKKHTQDLNYMHRPPRIVPNYGKRKQVRTLPKTSVSRVLLYDNVTQQQMLDVKVSSILSERRKTGRLLDMHRNSFIVRKLKKHVRENVLDVEQAMPVHVTPTKVMLPATRGHARSLLIQQRQQQPPPPPTPSPPPLQQQQQPHAEEETIVVEATSEPKRALGKQDVILEEDEAVPEITAITITTTTTTSASAPAERSSNAGTVSATKAKMKISAQDSSHEEHGDLETLILPPATQPQERYGASTSFGFSQQEPGLAAGASTRSSHTAAATFRDGGRRGKGGGGGGHSSDHLQSHGLPDINAGGGQHPASRMVLHTDNKNGLTRLFHAFQQHLPPELASLGAPKLTAAEIALAKDRQVKHAFEERTTEDNRYIGLESLLVKLDPPNDGYWELSPSFHTPRKAMTLSRPASLQSPSVFRRRRRSSSSNQGSVAMPAAAATTTSTSESQSLSVPL